MRPTPSHIVVCALLAFVAGAALLGRPSSAPPRTEPPGAGPIPTIATAPTSASPSPAHDLRARLRELAGLYDRIRPPSPSRDAIDAFTRAGRRLDAERPSVEELSALLASDPDPGVRLMAIQTLGRLGGPEALAALDAARRNETLDDALRLTAVETLAAIEGADPEPVLIDILAREPGRTVAAAELGRRRSTRAVGALSSALADASDLSLACHAASALGQIGGPEARRALEYARSRADDPTLQRSVQQALSFLETSP